MQTKVKQSLANAIAGQLATAVNPCVINEMSSGGDKLIIGATDPETGERKNFVVRLEETKEGPLFPQPAVAPVPSQEADVKPKEGCCGASQTCAEVIDGLSKEAPQSSANCGSGAQAQEATQSAADNES